VTTYIRAKSWHLLRKVTDAGWITRCGLTLNEDADVAYELKLNQKTCESCLRYAKRDEEINDPPNDVVPG
jgi:hypothetical protein